MDDPLFDQLTSAAALGDVPGIRAALEAGAPIDRADSYGYTALHYATRKERADALSALLEAGADPTPHNSLGVGPVHVAAQHGDLETLRRFAAHGVDLDLRSAAGLPPLYFALAMGHTDCVQLLLGRALHAHIVGVRASFEPVRARAGDALAAKTAERVAAWAARVAKATELTALPSGPPKLKDRGPGARLLGGRAPLDAEAWRSLLDAHARWLDTGGAEGLGAWEHLGDTGLSFGCYDGPRGSEGRQADVHWRRVEGADARGARLARAHLVGMSAPGLDLRGADLSQALALSADLRGARFDGADLTGVDFSDADLRGASFEGADLTLTDFERCDLRGARFHGARLRGTMFPHADLDGAVLGPAALAPVAGLDPTTPGAWERLAGLAAPLEDRLARALEWSRRPGVTDVALAVVLDGFGALMRAEPGMIDVVRSALGRPDGLLLVWAAERLATREPTVLAPLLDPALAALAPLTDTVRVQRLGGLARRLAGPADRARVSAALLDHLRRNPTMSGHPAVCLGVWADPSLHDPLRATLDAVVRASGPELAVQALTEAIGA